MSRLTDIASAGLLNGTLVNATKKPTLGEASSVLAVQFH
jgi:hypothetical protein